MTLPWAGELGSACSWLWGRGTLYRAPAMSAAIFRSTSCGAGGGGEGKQKRGWGAEG